LNFVDDIYQAVYEDVRHPLGEPCTNSQLMLSLSPSNSQAIATSPELKNQNLEKSQKLIRNLIGKSSPEKLPNPQIHEEKKNSLVVVIDMHHYTVRVNITLKYYTCDV
jgi:hypothetical protein